jgi:hypothetical protein
MSLADELMAIDVAVAATDAVWRKRARELIVRAVNDGRTGKVIVEGGLWRATCKDITWYETPEAIADRLLASVDKPGESGGANQLP